MEKLQRKSKGLFLRLVALSLAALFVLTLSFLVYYFSLTSSVRLNTQALALGGDSKIEVFTSSGNQVKARFSQPSKINLEELPDLTSKAFISMEDKKFYRHNGIDYLRIGGAILNNIKAGKIKQGGSTISQQLVKNSQLSHEKTLDRKLKEIKLTRDLERKYEKNEILEMYLNTIYFGNGCYGISDAASFYFDKDACDLSLCESAMLAAIINAPSVYNPKTSPEKCTARKNLVLKNMFEDGIISEQEYQNALNEEVKVYASNGSNAYSQAVISEACDVLNVRENALINMNLKIYTYLDEGVQNEVEALIASGDYNPKNNGARPTASTMVVDNNTGGVLALASTTNDPLNEYHQPGSVLKPLVVYAPALDAGIISPVTKIDDSPIDISGFSPQNASKTYHGVVPISFAVEKSLNVPAVRVMQWTGVAKSKDFANRLGIKFEESDNSLALALGAMEKGVTLGQITDAYSAFACGGGYKKSHFISRIENGSGDVLYSNNTTRAQAMSEATAYLMTDILKGVAENGTASRLKGLGVEVAAKTGTVGAGGGASENISAWSVAFTRDHTIATHIGAIDSSEKMPATVNGSTYPTILNRNLLNAIYKSGHPADFERPQSVITADIDLVSYSKNLVELANANLPERYRKTALFNANYLPKTNETQRLDTPTFSIKSGNNIPQIALETQENLTYEISRNGQLIASLPGSGNTEIFTDNNAPSQTLLTYIVTSKNGSAKSQPSKPIKVFLVN